MFTIPEVVGFMINFCITMPVTIGIISLLVYQSSLTLGNLTSIEEHTEKRFRRLARRRGMEVLSVPVCHGKTVSKSSQFSNSGNGFMTLEDCTT
jgi:hypothetical protein